MINNKVTLGILAHVDAGKTTLSETLLYNSGSIKEMGRVDHQDAFLDTFELEKARGITIFSKQALFQTDDYQITLLDTPGHVDFSAEMERTLQVLDYAILVVNGADGVQGHTLTLWRLLSRYEIPVFIFVNKMDQVGADREFLLQNVKEQLDERCIDFTSEERDESFYEQIALCQEQWLDLFLEKGVIEDKDIGIGIKHRQVIPVYFGSALKNEGVTRLIEQMNTYMVPQSYPDAFGAKVFKITRDEQGQRLAHLKLTGGSLRVKESIEKEGIIQKVNQIRIYSGKGYEAVQDIQAGSICAVTGLDHVMAGHGLGFETDSMKPALTPVLNYKVELPPECQVVPMLQNLRELEEEEPHLNIVWNETAAEIHAQVMGDIEVEILKSIILERYGVEVSFGTAQLVYKETIKYSVEGIGHFEPLRHYAEVHLLMEPGEIGSGMVYAMDCSEDILAGNWQRLIVTHLKEREHLGVLTGSPITDMKITVVTGRAHVKHTEGGDFREATYRAIRQGLMKTESRLLEPVYQFRMELPREYLGRAMADVIRLHGEHDDPIIHQSTAVLTGMAPVQTMMTYTTELMAYTKGEGRLILNPGGYRPCHNEEEVIERFGYDPEADIEHPAYSVFCSKGVGYHVPWYMVDEYQHVESGIQLGQEEEVETVDYTQPMEQRKSSEHISQDEIENIMLKTYGPKKEKNSQSGHRIVSGKPREKEPDWSLVKKQPKKESYLLVDGYNIIFAWEELKQASELSLDAARMRLLDIMSHYKSQTDATVIVVFDAYKVKGNPGSVERYHNIHVVYTKEAETADEYIERLVTDIRPSYDVTVATSDAVEQVIIMGKGARRLSAAGLEVEVHHALTRIHEEVRKNESVSNRIQLPNDKKNKE